MGLSCPAFQDLPTLAKKLGVTESLVEVLVARGALPPPLSIGGEKRWKWAEVETLMVGRVYFIDGGDLIKIGFTKSMRRRTRDIQKHSPVKLKVLCAVVGGKLREAAFHETFAHLRAHGEWFHATPELREYIAVLKARPFEADRG